MQPTLSLWQVLLEDNKSANFIRIFSIGSLPILLKSGAIDCKIEHLAEALAKADTYFYFNQLILVQSCPGLIKKSI